MTLRIHILQHVPHEDAGSLAPVFAAHGAVVTVTRFFADDPLPERNTFDMLVVLGGPMNVYEQAKYPWLAVETAFIDAALQAGKAVLGLCLGAQLMAVALGGAVTANPHREIGWWPVERLPDADGDERAACFPARFTTFHWHGDTFSIPPGAVSLFHSEACAHQGFAWGARAVGLQFHPEITADAVDAWIAVAEGAASTDVTQKSGTTCAGGESGGDLRPGPYVQTAAAMKKAAGVGAGLVVENNGAMEKLFTVLTQGLRR